jgi:DNA repair exonuclease SbcCD nuclease subunit
MGYLISSDWHLHNWKNFGIDTNVGISKRLLDQQKVLNQIYSIYKEKNITQLLFGGDLFHAVENVPVDALNVASVVFKLFSYLLCGGNHDFENRKNPRWFNYSGGPFTLLNRQNIPKNIKLVHYYEDINYDTLKGYDIVILHKTPRGSKIGNYVFDEGVDWETISKNNRLVFCGHIHQRQQLGDNFYIIGTPMHLNFADTNDRGIYIVDDSFKVEFIKLDYPQFVTVENPEDVKQDGNYYRVLNACNLLKDENVIISITKPKFYEERIKTTNFYEVLQEWLRINSKDESYLSAIQDLIDEKIQSFKKIFKGKISKVEIKNFLTIKHVIYDVPTGFVLIKGQNESGKTNLFDAIYWCLYGKTTKELNLTDVTTWGESVTEVTVYLEGPGGGVGKIVRDSKEGVHVYKSIEDKTPLTEGLMKDRRQEILETSLLGISEEVFLSACYISQENLKILTQLGDTDKTNIISKLLGFEVYSVLYTKVFDKIKINNQEIGNIQQEIEKCKYSIQECDSNIKIIINQQKLNEQEINNFRDKIRQCQEGNTKLKSVVYKPLESENINYDKSITQTENSIKILQEEIKKLENSKESILLNINSVCSKLLIKNGELGNFNSDIKRIILREENIKNLEGKCDKCNSVIIEENKEKFLRELKLERLGVEEKVGVLEVEIKTISEKRDVLVIKEKDIKDHLNKKKVSLEANVKDLSLFNNNKIKQLEVQKTIESEKNSVQLKIKNNLDLIEVYDTQIKEINNKNNLLFQQIASINCTRDKFIEVKKGGGDKVQGFEEVNFKLEFWKEAFSPKGIKPLLLDRFCNEFNLMLSEYVSIAFNNTLLVSLTPTKIIGKGEERNKLGEQVIKYEDGREIYSSYKALSGGAKRKVDVAQCLALNKWISKKYGVTRGLLGFLVLDEVFSFIDKGGEESLSALLRSEGENKAVFVITHTPSLEAFAEKIWEVVKETNGTQVYVGGK